MQQTTVSPLHTLAEVVSDASGILAPLIHANALLDADLGLSFNQIVDLRYAVEFEFGIEICADTWLQHCDAISSILSLVEEHIGRDTLGQHDHKRLPSLQQAA